MSSVEDILQRFHIPYVERGSNVKKGNINVRCPFCMDDPSHHMGIMPESGWYACWRDKGHRGKNFPRLLAALAQISYERAQIVAGEYFSVWAKEDAFDLAIKAMAADDVPKVAVVSTPTDRDVQKTMKGFRPIVSTDVLCRRHRTYLTGRGFSDVDRLAKRYSLMYALTGPYKERIIIPYYHGAEIVTWAARSIYRAHSLRYLALPDEHSTLTTKEVLYNSDRAMTQKGGVLFVVEGPFDCIKFDYFSRRIRGCVTVGLSSVAIEDAQLVRLMELIAVRNFQKVILMMDANELAKAMQMQGELGRKALVFDWARFGGNCKDPGQFNEKRVALVAKHYAVS